jgi:hypothetical protein
MLALIFATPVGAAVGGSLSPAERSGTRPTWRYPPSIIWSPTGGRPNQNTQQVRG